jgi:sugar lactone lactonase YvrE
MVHPYFIAVDTAGNVYVTEPSLHRIQKFDASGARVAQWGGFGSGISQLNSPQGIAVDAAGNVYVADRGNFRIQKFTSTGTPLARWGTPMGNQSRPLAIAVGGPGGNVYITDGNLKRVYVFSSSGALVRSFGGATGTADGQFSVFQPPGGIAVDSSGNVYVADTGNNRIQKFDPLGNFLWKVGQPASGTGDGQFFLPNGLAFDAAGNLYAVDTANHRVQRLGQDGTFKAKWGSNGTGPGQFSGPLGAATDSTGNVYVTDTGNHRVQKVGPSGTFISMLAGDVRLSASHGEAPGFVNPIVLARASSTQSIITVTSVNQYAGAVDLKASCCVRFDTGLGVPMGQAGILVPQNLGSVNLQTNPSGSVVLNIGAAATADPGKYIATVTATNPSAGINRVLGVVFTIPTPPGAGIQLSASPGRTPGVSYFLPTIVPVSFESQLTIQSVNGFSGQVSLAAFCCEEIWRRRWIPIPGAHVNVDPQTLHVSPGGSATAKVRVTIPGVTSADFPTALLTSEYGKFLVMVEAAAANLQGIRSQTSVGITAPPASQPYPTCANANGGTPGGTFVIDPRTLLMTWLPAADANTPLGAFAIYPTTGSEAWKVEIQRGGVAPGQTVITLRNPKGRTKEITTVGCSTAGKVTGVAAGNSGTLTLVKGADRTLLLRESICTARFLNILWCTATTMITTAVFAEPGFWSFAETSRITITWFD